MGQRYDMSGAWKPIATIGAAKLLLATFTLDGHSVSSMVIPASSLSTSAAYPALLSTYDGKTALLYHELSNDMVYGYCDAGYSTHTPSIEVYKMG